MRFLNTYRLKKSNDKCSVKYPEQAPDWLKQNLKEEVNGKGKNAERTQKFQAKLAITRGVYCEDNNDTRLSC